MFFYLYILSQGTGQKGPTVYSVGEERALGLSPKGRQMVFLGRHLPSLRKCGEDLKADRQGLVGKAGMQIALQNSGSQSLHLNLTPS